MRDKKANIILLIVLLSVLQLQAWAQEFYMETSFEAKLESILTLNVDPEVRIEFEISKVNDNLYQITQLPDDVQFSVESTSNWRLSIAASDPYFRGVNDPLQTIPIDFMSFYIENLGNNWDNGPFSNMANKSKDSLLTLSENKTVVLADGRKSNIGGSPRNSFVLRWKFNFEGDMTKMREFSNLDLQDDQFVGHFYITLSESDVSGSSISMPAVQEPAKPDNSERLEISESIPLTGGFSNKTQKKKDKEK